MSDSIDYILNDERTQTKLFGETIEQFNEKQLGRECQYIENDIKTVNGAYVAVQNLVASDVSGAVKEMMDVKKFYGKLGGRAALHGIISLPVEESGKEHASELIALCADVMKKIFPNHQAVFAVHTNTDNLHIHFIVNSVGLDGKKIHQPKNFMSKVLQPCINEYAMKYGFTPNAEWGKPQTEKVSEYVNLKMDLREAIDLAIESADSFEEFVEILKTRGFRVNCGKHISIQNEDMEKAVRTYRLGINYSKESIIERIISRKLAFEQFHVSSPLRATMAQSDMAQDFTPVFTTMKKYHDMSASEKKQVIDNLKDGVNPWRARSAMSWHLKEIADEFNMTVRAGEYIKAYSHNGTVESALENILEEKKKIAAEKKTLKQYMRLYKPIIDIYNKMQKIERKSYLYEHEGRGEYRGEYEEYRALIRRLKNGYNKNIFDVAQFIDSYQDQYRYLNSQMSELSREYRELKQYAEMKGISETLGKGLWDTIGYDELKNEAKKGVFEADVKFLISRNNPDLTIRIVKSPYSDKQGKIKENVNIALMSRYGEILEQHELAEGTRVFKEFVSKLEDTYGLKQFESFKNAALAREYSSKCRDENSLRAMMAQSDKPIEVHDSKKKKTYSFTQAINILSANEEKGMYVIANAENPSYIGIVYSDQDSIRLKISDLRGNLQEEFEIPSLKNRNQNGYNLLKSISQKYGFSDEIYTFKNMDEARKYSVAENINNIKM